jgi:hypothetical protein
VFAGGAALDARVRFRDGRFLGARLTVTLPWPGPVIAPKTHFAGFGGELGLDPLTISADATIGAFPIPPNLYTIDVNGKLTVSFPREVVFRMQAVARLLQLRVSSAQATFTTAGDGSITGESRLDLGVVSAGGALNAAVDGPRGRFSGGLEGGVEVLGIRTTSGALAFGNAGIGACVSAGVEAGAFVNAGGDIDLFGPGVDVCDLGELQRRAGAAQAGSPTFRVPRGANAASVEVRGVGGVPDVVLVSPAGERITPVEASAPDARTAKAVSAAAPELARRSIGLNRPAAGSWRVEATGGTPIAAVRTALPLPAPRISARVRGSGARRVLAYRASGLGRGTTVRVFERGAGVTRPLGTLRAGAGTLRLRAGEGRGGPRTVLAFVERRAPVRRPQLTLARYVAPGAALPGAPRRPRATLRSGVASVSFGTVPGARRYLVRITLRDGRVLARETRSTRVQVRGLGAPARLLRVTVAARTSAGLSGPAAPARLG